MENDPTAISPKIRKSARELRRTMTPSERVLWDRLRLQRLDNLHFRKQHPFGPFILDFACLPIFLGVELDGWVHENTASYDRNRDAFLKRHGWTIIRFRNEEIVFDLDGVVKRIGVAAARLNGSGVN
jgi:very-short-patch-repair endonuclease